MANCAAIPVNSYSGVGELNACNAAPLGNAPAFVELSVPPQF